MTTVAPPGPRFSVETTFDGTRVVIPAKRNLFVVAFMAVWLCGWAFGEVTVVGFLGELFASEGGLVAAPFLLFWLCGWTLGGAAVITFLLWNLIGREVITFEHGTMIVAKRIGPLGLPRRYDLAHVRDARVSPPSVTSRRGRRRGQNPFTGGKIAFDYGARTFRFGTDLDEAEAKYLLDILHPRLPRASER